MQIYSHICISILILPIGAREQSAAYIFINYEICINQENRSALLSGKIICVARAIMLIYANICGIMRSYTLGIMQARWKQFVIGWTNLSPSPN